MFAEALRKWWDRRSDDQRARLKKAAEKHQLEPDIVQLLVNTKCPVGPSDAKWESQPEYSSHWPEEVRAFVAAQ